MASWRSSHLHGPTPAHPTVDDSADISSAVPATFAPSNECLDICSSSKSITPPAMVCSLGVESAGSVEEGSAAAPVAAAAEEEAASNGTATEAWFQSARAAVADTVAAALTWHTPRFKHWKSETGSGTIVSDAPRPAQFTSGRFQWLPADVLVGADGRIVLDSYINNLHPDRHAHLYAAAARLLQRMLPLFERTLAVSAQLAQRVAVVPPCEAWWEPEDLVALWEGMKEAGTVREFVRAVQAAHAQQQAAFGFGGHNGTDFALPDIDDEDMDYNDTYVELEDRWLEVRTTVGPRLPDDFTSPPSSQPVDLKGQQRICLIRVLRLDRFRRGMCQACAAARRSEGRPAGLSGGTVRHHGGEGCVGHCKVRGDHADAGAAGVWRGGEACRGHLRLLHRLPRLRQHHRVPPALPLHGDGLGLRSERCGGSATTSACEACALALTQRCHALRNPVYEKLRAMCFLSWKRCFP